jgi:pyrroloquinoline quinone biosynthesis protein B
VDCIAGLLSLRESQKLAIYAGGYVRQVIEENPIFRVLDRSLVRFSPLPMDQAVDLADADGEPLGLALEAFAVPGKIPLYHEVSDDIGQLASNTAVIGLSITGGGRRVIYIPGCAAVDKTLQARVQNADLLFFDGTLWQDDEMIRAGTGRKTGRRMGHMSIAGAEGSLAAFADVAGRKVFIHINNTNPILCADTPEAAAVRQAGWEIAHDGMAFTL